MKGWRAARARRLGGDILDTDALGWLFLGLARWAVIGARLLALGTEVGYH